MYRYLYVNYTISGFLKLQMKKKEREKIKLFQILMDGDLRARK